jgi:hypothetical protein
MLAVAVPAALVAGVLSLRAGTVEVDAKPMFDQLIFGVGCIRTVLGLDDSTLVQ